MKKIVSICFLGVLVGASVKGQTKEATVRPSSVEASIPFTVEIPMYKEGRRIGETFYLYKYIRQEALGLGLMPLEMGFDSFQIRIWLGHSLAKKRNVVILMYTGGQWSGLLVTYLEPNLEKDKSLFIERKEIKEIHPVSGWATFVKKMNDLKIPELPNPENLQGYKGGGMDGIDYYFEISTKRKYRFFYYGNPDENREKFGEARHVLEFASFLESEFGFTYTK